MMTPHRGFSGSCYIYNYNPNWQKADQLAVNKAWKS